LRLRFLRFAGFSGPKAANRRDYRLGPARIPLISRRNLLGCHGISSAKKGLGRPQSGSALHHLVTALSVKKALMIGCAFCAHSSDSKPVVRPAHTRSKCELELDRRIARARGKRIVNGIAAQNTILPLSRPVWV
jgi:hypothetical protein